MQVTRIQPYELEPDPLYVNDEGASVTQLQLALTALNCYHAEINGQFDVATQTALIKFQNDRQLNERGYLGPETWYAMTFWANEEGMPRGSQLAAPLWDWGRRLVSQMSLRFSS